MQWLKAFACQILNDQCNIIVLDVMDNVIFAILLSQAQKSVELNIFSNV